MAVINKDNNNNNSDNNSDNDNNYDYNLLQDEENNIENCLTSINEQTYPNIEVIVVDNNSTDKTFEIALKFTDKVFN